MPARPTTPPAAPRTPPTDRRDRTRSGLAALACALAAFGSLADTALAQDAGAPAGGAGTGAWTPPRADVPAQIAGDAIRNQDDLRVFIAAMADRHGFAPDALVRLMASVRHNAAAIRFSAPTPPSMTPSWIAYRARFIEPIRLRHGLAFWRDNAPALERAQRQYGVPAEVIVSVIGVETIYGRQTGDFRVIDALATLAFDDGRRPDLYRGELEAFLLWTRESGIDPFEPRGSYAGAIGLPQFMPSSIRRWGVDFDGSGRVDLRGSAVDAIGSVARFLAEHGWQPGATAVWTARIARDARLQPVTEGGIEPRFTIGQLATYGVDSPDPVPSNEPLALVEFQNGDQPNTFRLAARNFWVVTRYNRSRYYAMAVLELADTLRQARAREHSGMSAPLAAAGALAAAHAASGLPAPAIAAAAARPSSGPSVAALRTGKPASRSPVAGAHAHARPKPGPHSAGHQARPQVRPHGRPQVQPHARPHAQSHALPHAEKRPKGESGSR